ncbi:IS21 family transposase, partial [Brevibacterium sp. NPDC049920]
WAIHYLADQVFASLDDLNEALAERVEWINHRTPFRGEERSRHAWFTEAEKPELLELPEHRWEPVVWRKAKVHRDWHIQIDTIKYSVPYEFAGVSVDVRIVGSQVEVLAGGDVVARHRRGRHRNGYVTDPDHAPAYLAETAGLWTRAYFLRQAAKVGPATVAALERLLDRKKIEAQGFRSCMNILDLGKRRGRVLLEQACQHLIDSDEHRQITYTAVKNTTSALQAQQDERPRTLPAAPPGTAAARASSAGRDTSGAHLAGISAFSLEALTAQNTREADDA